MAEQDGLVSEQAILDRYFGLESGLEDIGSAFVPFFETPKDEDTDGFMRRVAAA